MLGIRDGTGGAPVLPRPLPPPQPGHVRSPPSHPALGPAFGPLSWDQLMLQLLLVALPASAVCVGAASWEWGVADLSHVLRIGAGTWSQSPPVHGTGSDMKHQDIAHSCTCRMFAVTFLNVILAVLLLVPIFMWLWRE